MRGSYHIKKAAFRRGALAVLLLALFAMLPASGCGYKVAGQSTGLPESIKTLAITVFENDSSEPNVEEAVTRGILRRFVRDGRLRIVSRDKADSILSGTVIKYKLEPVAWDSFNYVTQYIIRLYVRIDFKDTTGNDIHISQVVYAQSSYRLNISIVTAESARQDAITAVSLILGDTLVGLLLEGFK